MAYLPILTYHRLLAGEPTQKADPKRISVSVHQFESHLKWLRRLGYKTVSLEKYVHELRAGLAPQRKTFAITFDDGYEEVFTLGLPLLKKYGFTAMIFAVPGVPSHLNTWDDSSAMLMNPAQFSAWLEAGMEVGAHTSHHKHLPKESLDVARNEIVESKKLLEAMLQRPIPLFAYPYGEYNSEIEKLVKDAGFDSAFATDRAPTEHSDDLYALRRAVIFPKSNAWNVLWKVQPWYPSYQDKRRAKPRS